MPEMDGISYLEKHFNSSHPPVVMISSASRDDSDLAIKAIELGAVDFVEKPELNNMQIRGEEIKNKLKVAVASGLSVKGVSHIDHEFEGKVEIQNPFNKLQILIVSLKDKEKLLATLNHWGDRSPATVLFFEGHSNLLAGIQKDFKENYQKDTILLSECSGDILAGNIYIADLNDSFAGLYMKQQSKETNILIFGRPSNNCFDLVKKWNDAYIIIEDLGDEQQNKLKLWASDIMPVTSFAYMSDLHFVKKEKK